jgi:outer membrane protein assembly factor BamB
VWGDDDRNKGHFLIRRIYGFNQEDNVLYFDYEYSGIEVSDDTCVVGCLSALEINSGKPVWSEPIPINNPNVSWAEFYSFNVFKDYIYQAFSHDLFIFEKENGNLVNSIHEDRYFNILPTNNYVILYYPDLGIANGINPITNEVLWEDDEFLYERWLLSLDNKVIYIDDEYDLVGLDILTGEQIWKIEGKFGLGFTYTVNNNVMIHKEWNDHLQLFDLNTGAITDIYTDGGWGNATNEHFQIIDNNRWLYFGDHIALLQLE